jgi:hypothetical protein
MSPELLLTRLEKLRNLRDQQSIDEKLLLLQSLQKRRFRQAEPIRRFHDILCFLRAYPENNDILRQVESCLDEFSSRSDLRRHRNELASSGIAGSPIDYRFFHCMASWLARHWGKYLHIDWPEVDDPEKLMEIIPLLVSLGESSLFDDFDYSPRDWLQRLKGENETDAEFLIKRINTLYRNSFEREALHDKLNLPFRLLPGPDTPSVTSCKYLNQPVSYVHETRKAKRPNLRQVINNHPVSIRKVSESEGEKLIDLARTAMMTHERDIDAFSYGSKKDVRLVDCGDGLQFICIGTLPERRYLLPGLYGFLNLKNGVPTGYFQVSVIGEMAEVSFNTFSSFRGSDAAIIYARALAMTHQLFGVKTFVLDNYQLGHSNKEGLLSGVWWFYYKLGFRPRNRETMQLISKELATMKRKPGHRSSLNTLTRLAEDYMYFELDPEKINEDLFPMSWNIAPGISTYLAKRFGAEREKGIRICINEVIARLGLRKLPVLTRDERQAWIRWAPLIVQLKGIERWSQANRRKLVKIVKAKGGQRESDYIHLFSQHKPLQRAIIKFSEQVEI